MTSILTRLTAALADRYRVEGEIGTGGMALVFLAHDIRNGRRVAIKVLRPELALSLGAERFLDEIQTTARLQHPHILPLFDSGAVEGLLYYIMPLVEGESLRQRMDRERQMPVPVAVRIAREVADALGYAHNHPDHVIHRDVKPENIMLTHDHALVADFGIAKALSAAGSRLTQAGAAMGTPAYMSPEQAGEESVDARSDQYSLACVLFEMLTGELPFQGNSAYAILLQRLTRHPPRLSTRRAGISGSIDAAIQRAMARDPAERFPDLAAFSAALVASAPAATMPVDKSIAVLPFTNMSRDPEDEFFTDGITEEIINALTQLEGLRVAARMSSFAFKGTQEDMRAVAERLGVHTILEGSVRRSGKRLRITAQLVNAVDGYQLWSERYDLELTDVFSIQDQIASAIAARLRITLTDAGASPAGRIRTGHLEAYEQFLKGRVLQVRRGRSIAAALECFEKAVALDPHFAEAQAWLADSYRLLAVYGMRAASEAMPRAKIAAERAVELDPDLAEAHATQADVALLYDRDLPRAEAAWERALTLNPSHVRARSERALWWYSVVLGDHDRAIAEARLAMENDPLNAWAAAMAGLALGLAGRFSEALSEIRRATELDPEGFMGRFLEIEAACWAGDYPAAIAAAEPTLLMSGRHPWALASLALTYAKAGDADAAEGIRAELVARGRTGYVQPFWMATAALATGRLEEALDMVRRSVAEHDPIVLWANRLPEWAPMREQPAMVELLRELRLAP